MAFAVDSPTRFAARLRKGGVMIDPETADTVSALSTPARDRKSVLTVAGHIVRLFRDRGILVSKDLVLEAIASCRGALDWNSLSAALPRRLAAPKMEYSGNSEKEAGIKIISGPLSAGKSTTIQHLMEELGLSGGVLTIEDPAERIDSVTGCCLGFVTSDGTYCPSDPHQGKGPDARMGCNGLPDPGPCPSDIVRLATDPDGKGMEMACGSHTRQFGLNPGPVTMGNSAPVYTVRQVLPDRLNLRALRHHAWRFPIFRGGEPSGTLDVSLDPYGGEPRVTTMCNHNSMTGWPESGDAAGFVFIELVGTLGVNYRCDKGMNAATHSFLPVDRTERGSREGTPIVGVAAFEQWMQDTWNRMVAHAERRQGIVMELDLSGGFKST